MPQALTKSSAEGLGKRRRATAVASGRSGLGRARGGPQQTMSHPTDGEMGRPYPRKITPLEESPRYLRAVWLWVPIAHAVRCPPGAHRSNRTARTRTRGLDRTGRVKEAAVSERLAAAHIWGRCAASAPVILGVNGSRIWTPWRKGATGSALDFRRHLGAWVPRVCLRACCRDGRHALDAPQTQPVRGRERRGCGSAR